MKHSTSRPTKAEAAHLAAVKAMRCLACELNHLVISCGPTEVHHTLSGNRRRGHMYVLPLGPWHHRGDPLRGLMGLSAHTAEAIFGPSLARSSKRFRARYGTDDQLLAIVQARLERKAA